MGFELQTSSELNGQFGLFIISEESMNTQCKRKKGELIILEPLKNLFVFLEVGGASNSTLCNYSI